MKITLKRSKVARSIKVYGFVQRDKDSRPHRVLYIRSKNFRGWLCDCEDFLFSQFAKSRNCDHIKEARQEVGRYGAEVQD